MEYKEKVQLLADLFEVETSEIYDEKQLSEFDTWDSMTKLSLIVLMDDECNKKLTGEQIRNFVTIGDILQFMD